MCKEIHSTNEQGRPFHSGESSLTPFHFITSRLLTAGLFMTLVGIPNSDVLAEGVSPALGTPATSYDALSTSAKSPASELMEAQVVQQGYMQVTGVVETVDGEPIPGVTVLVKGTRSGSITDLEGRYFIDVPSSNNSLEFSYYGYQTTNVLVGNQRIINVVLKEEVMKINDIVVTALGIRKKEKSLTYSTQVIDGKEVSRNKDLHLINTLAGKTAGVEIHQGAAGLGGSVKMLIRGSRSVSGSNQPLFVIDGIPINTGSKEVTISTLGGLHNAGNRDGGDGISNLNPDDIESLNILKGSAAAALYGGAAANGVVVVTTKAGKIEKTNITFNTSTTWDKATYGIPKFQNSYTGETSSWGEPIQGSEDYTKQFFRTGLTTINSLSLSSGSEALQTYFSYTNTRGRGVVPHSSLNRHNFNFRETANFFDQRMSIDANIKLVYQDVKNRPSPGGFYMNPLVGLYKFPRGGVQGGETFDYYRDSYRILDPKRNIYVQNWYTVPTSFEQNPFWLINMTPEDGKRYRTLANLSLSLKLGEYFSLQARGNADFISDQFEAKMYAGTDASLVGNNGRYISDESNELSLYGDAMLDYHQAFGDFDVMGTLGVIIKDETGKSLGFDSKTYLYNPNIFSIGNIDHNNGAPFEDKYHMQKQAVFFSGQLAFRDYMFLDFTARNDWTSTLAFTKYLKKGFFYPSIGYSWIMNETLKMPDWISLAKVRAAWSKVGNGLPRYLSNPLNSIGSGGVIDFNTTAPFSELKPEMTTSFEVGTEWRFFNNRWDVDVTYYQTRTKNQLFSMRAPTGSKYTTYYVNGGDIKNEGVEVVVEGSPLLNDDFKWMSSINFALNRNTVEELVDGLGYFEVGGGSSNSYTMRLEKGGSFGDIYGRKFLRDEAGNYQFDAEGMPIPDKTDLKKVGNATPDFRLGWQNTITYKGLTFYFLVDGSFGGDVMSLTEAVLDKYGVSKTSGEARANGGVNFGGHKISDVERFYTIVGGRDGITEYYMYDATNIRLRELSIGYRLPSKWVDKIPGVRNIELSFVGRNLFFIMNHAPYDPDCTLSVGNSMQGVDVFGMPSNRSLGFTIKANF